MASKLEKKQLKLNRNTLNRANALDKLLSDENDKRHGTTTGYNYGCRCERCKQAKREKGMADRARKTAQQPKKERDPKKREAERKAKHREDLLSNPQHPLHGTVAGYGYGCYCERCKAARREYNKRYHIKVSEKVAPAKYEVCTIAAIYVPMMGKPSIDNVDGCCAICGKPATDKHHIVKRSAGKLVVEGHELSKPTIRLCGMGNTSGCHGLAHQGRLHFKWVETESQKKRKGGLNDLYAPTVMIGGHWEYIITKEPCDYITALGKRGWKRVGGE